MVNYMGSSAILGRWICRSRAAGIIISRRSLCHYNSTGTFRSLDSCESAANSGFSSDELLPCLMLPPVLKGGDMAYKFRSLAADIVFNFSKNSLVIGKSEELPDDDAEFVGSSHGWVALFNRRNNDLFLSHPLSHRHIKLPPVDTLPDPHLNLDLDGHGSVSKVILSSSPDEEECRAMMSFGPASRLAFCLPGRSYKWTPIGDLFIDHDYPFVKFARVHDDLVYCCRRKVFTSITPCDLNFDTFFLSDERVRYGFISETYDWDIQDPASAKIVRSLELQGWKEDRNGNKKVEDVARRGRTRIWWEENMEFLKEQCIQIPHLVYAEQSDQLFLVLRFVMLMNPDGASPVGYIPSCAVKGLSDIFPCKTFGFIVMEMDEEGNCTVVEDLNAMSMFVGINQSFAISSTQLKPNSIYFTDAKRIRMLSGVNDNGIFDYESKTISSCSDRPCSPGAQVMILQSLSRVF